MTALRNNLVFPLLLVLSITLIAGNCHKQPTPTPPVVTDTEKPVISSFTVSGITSSAGTFNYTATDNKGVTSLSLTVTSAIDVTGTTSKTVDGLSALTPYTATLTAKDAAGNTATATVTFTTLTNIKPSTWLDVPQVTYSNPFSIEQNAVSNQLTITINNGAGAVKAPTSLIASFGAAGSAVKNLRYQLNGSSAWNSLSITNGSVNFGGINLQPGNNTFVCYFAIKVSAGVANGSALSLQFTSVDDGSGANAPVGGSFQSTVPLGTVNSVTQATVITTEWLGSMRNPNKILFAGVGARDPIYMVQGLRATGPAPARWGSIKLKNPYTAFSTITFDNSSWSINIQGGPDKNLPGYSWQSEYITLTLPNETTIIADGTTYNNHYINVSYQNTGSSTFNSDAYTSGLFGFRLTSKYDLIIYNSDGQVIDLSDAVIKQDGVILIN